MAKLSLRSAVSGGYLTIAISVLLLALFIVFVATDVLYAAFISLILLFTVVAIGAVGISEKEG
ncbi:MAG: hypothetical protein PHX75_01200 [Candidatus Methanomethylophilaceae archaeon]|nr:hypothetical protein [Candidatus Methanomethylophilaceae archaeon]